MSAIIVGFEYDIFISYRHNDNKYDGWVTEFVEKLQQELDATVKDKLTVFFDENPKEGLLETHQVDSSISSKIKSLLFIPIISQTYCDTSSFAWTQEFIAFKEEADKDDLGRNIRLQNGNYASRIIPVKIHEIENEDTQLLENELSGNLRSVDFIYSDSGVNRPLRPIDDDMIAGSSRLLYRNQINKVANAVAASRTGRPKSTRRIKVGGGEVDQQIPSDLDLCYGDCAGPSRKQTQTHDTIGCETHNHLR